MDPLFHVKPSREVWPAHLGSTASGASYLPSTCIPRAVAHAKPALQFTHVTPYLSIVLLILSCISFCIPFD